ncbi:V-type ATPase subunit [Anaerocolumna sp. AGMB13025]|uniref:V-type ATPase subunit n=1 Tax=Anaerocolumna sp. AGMB13025 TaxID=3039116 RepID=UPI00241E11F8|nr:V-type ATPase subunit [Anaerocolumna sp. AGMB13025]WFR57484.1 V-type ATPase subunit [Anaerocolumna sp. AGMB13025]
MGNLLTYSGIITKVRAMEANLISTEEYKLIAEFETTTEFFTFLKNHPGYCEIFNRYDEHGLHRGQAEGIFINALYLDFTKLYEFAGIQQRKLLDFIFFRYEVTILKACLQMVYASHEDYNLDLFTVFFTRHSNLDVKALAASHSMEEFINNLKDTRYYPLFSNLSNTPDITTYTYQMQLDIYYFKKAWQLKDKLPKGEDLTAFTNCLGTEIDLMNLLWLYRFIKFYSLPSADLYAYVIPITYKLTREKLMQLMETTSMEEFLAVIKTTYYDKISSAVEDGSIEITCEKQIARLYKDNMLLYPASMSPVNCYLFQKQNEIRKLTTVLECIRYKLSPQETLNYVFP